MPKPKKPTEPTDEQIAEQAVEALRKQAEVQDGELAWYQMSDDKSRIVVGSTHGPIAVFGVFGVTKAREVGAPQRFNLHHLKMAWRGSEEHPTPEETEADEAAHDAWREKNN